MLINKAKCINCQSCMFYCPVDAIQTQQEEVYINQELCVECAACFKSGVCKQEALYLPELKWPRILRSQFSDPLVSHPLTGIMGRGTAEMKTNDVTGRFKEGDVGFALEIGRPGISTRLADVERVAMSLVNLVDFEPLNPVTTLLDLKNGRFKDPTIRNERVLSAIIECKTTEENGLNALKHLKDIAQEIDTVFSLCIINRCQDFDIPFKKRLEASGYHPRINGKTNVGLGRPLQ